MVSHGVGLKNDRRTRLVAPGCPCPNPVLFVLEKLTIRFASSCFVQGSRPAYMPADENAWRHHSVYDRRIRGKPYTGRLIFNYSFSRNCSRDANMPDYRHRVVVQDAHQATCFRGSIHSTWMWIENDTPPPCHTKFTPPKKGVLNALHLITW